MICLGEIVSACILSAGGIGGVILTIVKFSSNSIAEHLSKKYELKMSKEIEKYRADIENKVYISKTKFDTEFEIYRRLSKVFSVMVKETTQLFPRVTRGDDADIKKCKQQYDSVIDTIVAAQDELYASAPFISENIYNAFLELEDMCKKQLFDFRDFRLISTPKGYRNVCDEGLINAYTRNDEIDKKFNNLLADIREYIARIDVIE